MSESHVAQAPYVALIPLLPLAGAIVLGFFGERMQARLGKQAIGTLAVATVTASFVLSLVAFLQLVGMEEHAREGGLLVTLLPWIHVGTLHVDLAFQVDPLSSAMILVVTGIGALIHLYATAYMHEDPAFWRFFAYMNLFIFAMLTLVLGDSLLLMFVGWEGVGFCSWALIGFWHQELPNTTAANKAFIFNRIGDFGFVLGIFLIFWSLDAHGHATLVFRQMREHAHLLDGMQLWGWPVVTLITLFLFVGATGKSAQIPLYVWLPDAMAGPTPVSALIHAATMVTAGLYMIARMNFLFSMSPATLHVVAIIGAATAVVAATIAITQNDIKKVLAYSTVSQLGYMFLAMGVGDYVAGMSHVITHAFFKACLFLGSGSVIHAMHHEQDMRKMGGLRPYMPRTFWTFLVATLAIAGVPGLAGFWSKDEILWMAYASPLGGTALWLTGVGVAALTACYMFRQVYMTFFGEPRWAGHDAGHGHGVAHAAHDGHGHGGGHATPHESPWQMTVPLVVLAIGAVASGLICLPHWMPFSGLLDHWLEPVVKMPEEIAHWKHEAYSLTVEWAVMAVSVIGAFAGIALATLVFKTGTIPPERFSNLAGGWLYRGSLDKWWVDELYEATVLRATLVLTRVLAWFDATIIDGIVNGAAALVRVVSRVEGLFDNYVVDGAVNGVANGTFAIGRRVRLIQSGAISAYLFVVVAGVLGGVLAYYYLAFAGTP
ncbi:MAG TPA: NADH-quinone oxidoreductase subunit L [Candidatus Eisenbacteria bacterium]|nr:NADH-quinone oxidoreductase subunit L [Candidatus Eisenbacteria bacterium]